MQVSTQPTERRLGGWHVLGMFVGGFTVIIGVNLFLAFSAVRTFPGIETDSAYVASQTFDSERRAQDALGWTVVADYTDARLALAITEPDGQPIRPEVISATLGRATTIAQDTWPEFGWDGSRFVTDIVLAPGNWNLRVELRADDGTPFRRRIPLWVRQ